MNFQGNIKKYQENIFKNDDEEGCKIDSNDDSGSDDVDDDFGGDAGDDDVVNDVHCNDGEVNDTKCSKPQGDSALHLLGS